MWKKFVRALGVSWLDFGDDGLAHHKDPQRSSQVLDGLRFPCSCRSCRSATEVHAQRLREGNISPVRSKRLGADSCITFCAPSRNSATTHLPAVVWVSRSVCMHKLVQRLPAALHTPWSSTAHRNFSTFSQFGKPITLPVGQRRHHQPLLRAQVLELVVEVDVGDGNHARTVVVDVVRRVRPPVEPCLPVQRMRVVLRTEQMCQVVVLAQPFPDQQRTL